MEFVTAAGVTGKLVHCQKHGYYNNCIDCNYWFNIFANVTTARESFLICCKCCCNTSCNLQLPNLQETYAIHNNHYITQLVVVTNAAVTTVAPTAVVVTTVIAKVVIVTNVVKTTVMVTTVIVATVIVTTVVDTIAIATNSCISLRRYCINCNEKALEF
jgi:hypothetical protein